MRQLISILLILVNGLVNSQDIELIEFSNDREFKIDCDYVKDCIDTVFIDSNILTIQFYSNVTFEYEIPPPLTYRLIKDSLIIENYSNPVIRDTIVYDSINKKYDSLKIINSYTIYSIQKKYWCRKFTIKFKGFRYIPQYISYNSTDLKLCTQGYYEYKIYQSDTINIINKNGYRDGTWIDFYETGEIRYKRDYKNGEFLNGYIYDKNGQIKNEAFEGGNQIITIEKNKE